MRETQVRPPPGRRRSRLEQLPARDRPRRGRPDLPARHLARDAAFRCRSRRQGPARRAPRCRPRSPASPAFASGSRVCIPSAVRAVATNTFRVAENAQEFVALAERTLGLPIDIISGHEEARLDVLRRRARAATVHAAATRDRHRGRVHRIHHRPRVRARAARIAHDRLRRRDATLLSRRHDHRSRARCRGDSGARRNRSHRERIRPRRLARSLRLVRHRGGARRHPRTERVLGRWRHARRPRAVARAHAGRRSRHASQARTRSKASARRCLRAVTRSWRPPSRSSDRAHRSRRRRAAPRRALRSPRAHDRRGCAGCDRRALHRALRTWTVRRRCASAPALRRSTARRHRRRTRHL